MKNWIIGAILILAAAAAYYYFKVYQPVAPVEPASAPVVIAEPVAEPEGLPEDTDSSPEPDPVFQAEVSTETEALPLPMLAESDPMVLGSLGNLLGEPAVARYIVNDNVISRVVATIDMLGSRQIPGVVQAVEGPASSFGATPNENPETVIRNAEGDPIPQFFVDPSNYQRYTPYVEALQAADTTMLLEIYQEQNPLFQEAFRQMGYTDLDFNDRLVVIIDELLATPDVPEPVNLIKPEAVYLFADPSLESLSAGQKIMIRMGSENAARVKSKLMEIRAGL